MATLTGKRGSIVINLSGKQDIYEYQNKDGVQLKEWILQRFLMPILQGNWGFVRENAFFLDIAMKQIQNQNQNQSKNSEEWQFYKDVLDVIQHYIQEQAQWADLEKRATGSDSQETMSSMVYRTAMVKLRPEYEVYNAILGKPKFQRGEEYHEPTLQEIVKWIYKERVEFQHVKKRILEYSRV